MRRCKVEYSAGHKGRRQCIRCGAQGPEGRGSGAQIKPVLSVPIITFTPAYGNTIEGCMTHKLGRDTDIAVKAVFKGLPYETQRRLGFTPKNPGEWVEGAQFWQKELASALPSRMYHEVMMLFIGWYARCLRMEVAT